jgi:hypothetical protein
MSADSAIAETMPETISPDGSRRHTSGPTISHITSLPAQRWAKKALLLSYDKKSLF